MDAAGSSPTVSGGVRGGTLAGGGCRGAGLDARRAAQEAGGDFIRGCCKVGRGAAAEEVLSGARGGADPARNSGTTALGALKMRKGPPSASAAKPTP